MQQVLQNFHLANLGFKLLQNKIFDARYPFILVWALTHRCNLDCHYCGLPRLKDSALDLRGDQLLSLLDKAIESKLKIVSITGGEPLLHPDAKNFIKTCKKNGVIISLNTNAHPVTKNLKLLKENVYQLVISLDGPKQAHDITRGKGSFDKVLEAIKALKKEKIKFYTTCVINANNLHLLEEIIQMGIENQIQISFQFVSNSSLTGENINNSLTQIQTNKLLSDLITLKKQHPKTIKNPTRVLHFWEQMNKNPNMINLNCKAGHVFARINPRGDMNRCGRRSNDIISYKDVIDKGFLSSFRSLDLAPKCKSCDAWSAVNLNTLY